VALIMTLFVDLLLGFSYTLIQIITLLGTFMYVSQGSELILLTRSQPSLRSLISVRSETLLSKFKLVRYGEDSYGSRSEGYNSDS
jgi:hypothetical protein